VLFIVDSVFENRPVRCNCVGANYITTGNQSPVYYNTVRILYFAMHTFAFSTVICKFVQWTYLYF